MVNLSPEFLRCLSVVLVCTEPRAWNVCSTTCSRSCAAAAATSMSEHACEVVVRWPSQPVSEG